MGTSDSIGGIIAGVIGIFFFGGLFVLILIGVMLLMFALVGMTISGVIAGVGATHYTVVEFIPYKNLPECNNLNLTEEFVWNSPRQVPEGIEVIRCNGGVYYDGGGKPLFNMGGFSPPSDFPIRQIEWGFLGKLKSISFEDGVEIKLKDVDLNRIFNQHYRRNPPIGVGGLYNWGTP